MLMVYLTGECVGFVIIIIANVQQDQIGIVNDIYGVWKIFKYNSI